MAARADEESDTVRQQPPAAAETVETAEEFEVALHESEDRVPVCVRTRGYKPANYYATNLNLTGQANWFGSLNLSNMLAEHGCAILRRLAAARGSGDGGGRGAPRPLRVVEVGCGLGRAGLLAAHAMALAWRPADGGGGGEREGAEEGKGESDGNEGGGTDKGGSHVNGTAPRLELLLTDGEEEMVALARANVGLNGFRARDSGTDVDAGACGASGTSSALSCDCALLRWGDAAALEGTLRRYPGGFDLIIGADLIYGKAQADIRPLLATVRALLRAEHEDDERRDAACPAAAAAPAAPPAAPAAPLTTAARGGREEGGTGTTGAYPDSGCEDLPAWACANPADGRPAFLLAFTRRDLAPEALTELAEREYGLEWQRLDDFNFDVFDSDAHVESEFWRDTIFIFRRKLGGDGGAAQAQGTGGGEAAQEDQEAVLELDVRISSFGSCKNCPSGKYQDASSHRSSCKLQAECSYGEYFSGSSSSSGSCKNCPSGKYQDAGSHRSSCKWRAECSYGEYFSGGSTYGPSGGSYSYGSCKDCTSGQYQASSRHRSSCKWQAECSYGEYFSGGSGSSPGSCKNCPSGKYQDAGSHRSSCQWQAECSYGGSARGGGSACRRGKDCRAGEYQASIRRRQRWKCKGDSSCCGGGSGGSGSSSGSCKNCPSGKYQDAGSHRSSCKWQAECSYGEYFSGVSSSFGSCKDCHSGQYQASSSHRSSCKWQAECSYGKYFSGGQQRM
eukprot:g1233.t1